MGPRLPPPPHHLGLGAVGVSQATRVGPEQLQSDLSLRVVWTFETTRSSRGGERLQEGPGDIVPAGAEVAAAVVGLFVVLKVRTASSTTD